MSKVKGKMDIKVTIGLVIVCLSYGKVGRQLKCQKYSTVAGRNGNMLNMKELLINQKNN